MVRPDQAKYTVYGS